MNINALKEAVVIHKSFGEGYIKRADEQYIEVDFLNGRSSKFQFPMCFDRFLILKDKRKQNAVINHLNKWKIESGENEREELRLKYQKTQEGIIARRIAAEERKIRAASRSRSQILSRKDDGAK